MVSLFDNVERFDTNPATFSEPQFTYLNRSNRSVIAKARELLDEWFSKYPDKDKPDLRRRLRDLNDIEHNSAMFELFLHELLLRLGCRVEVHPTLSDSSKHPDFLVRSSSGQQYYLEAIVITDQSADEKAAEVRVHVVYDILNQLDSPNFFIGMDIKGSPKSPPPAKKIKRFLEKQIADLDPDEHTSENVQQYRWSFNHDGWDVEFFPVPKSPSARGEHGIRPLGMQIYELDFLTPEQSIRSAVMKKAARYGDIDLPYVIAVNTLRSVDRSDVLEALFGEQRAVRSVLPSGPGGWRLSRLPDGAWTSSSGPRYTRVSAVLVVNGSVLTRNTFRDRVCLYHNPWAQHPYSLELTRLTQAIPSDGQIEWRESIDGALLDTLIDWPEDS